MNLPNSGEQSFVKTLYTYIDFMLQFGPEAFNYKSVCTFVYVILHAHTRFCTCNVSSLSRLLHI